MDEEPLGPRAVHGVDTEDQGGEPACLLALLCPSCDAVPESAGSARCRRCGADLRERREDGGGGAGRP
ncbi:hypothetical protein [Kitasatospora sp. DSM 101779]|uniref:hypothetical protein n=1 Tax=Kitasatospora sp. DSM 101779 TaxID=2853165 RepID=UPI0021D86BC3|nr:hypothetical protein [Kitasatospora sp. DSM 101779]MCU7821395.1 hypothetical protein [Kitasatospora sp. DSM 101779]